VQLDRRESKHKHPFLSNMGELGSLISEFDWAETSLGPLEKWPDSLRTSLSIVLGSGVPMFMIWGKDRFFFYNDAFSAFFPDYSKKPLPFKTSFKEALPSGWENIYGIIEQVINQKSTRLESNIVTAVSRNNTMQEVYLTVGCSAVFNQNGTAEGVFGTCIENSAVIPNVIKSGSLRTQLNSVLMQSKAGIAQANIDGRVTEVNDRYCEMLGYSREEILQMNLGELTHPDDLQRNMQLLKECVSSGKDFMITKRYVKRDGSILWVNNNVSIVSDTAGSKYITAIAVDITAEKKREEQLEAGEFRFRTLIEKAPVGTALFRGSEFYIELANHAVLQYWEKEDDIIGSKLKDVFFDLNDYDLYEKLSKVYLTGKEYKASAARIKREESEKNQYFDYSLTPLFDKTGCVYAVLAMYSDVTPAVKAQQQAAESHNELAVMFEQSPVGIATIGIGDDLVFISANTFYSELVGRKAKDIIGKPLLEALPEIKGQGFDDLLREVIRTGTAYTAKEVEVELLRNEKLEHIYVDLTYQINRNAQGEQTVILVVATDVTRQVMSRREVEESETKLKNLIAAAPAGIGLFTGRDLIIEYPNQTFIDIVGKGPDILGLPLREAMPELISEGQAYLKILDDIFTTGIPFISPASLVKIMQNGVLNDNYYNISYTPLRNKSGEIYAILDIAIDVTEQVSAQKAMQESEAHLQLLRDTVPAMIFYLDKEQRYQSYNRIFMDWFSVDENEAIGKSVKEFLGEAAYAKTLPHLEIAYGGEQEKYEMFAPSRMGISRWLSIVYTPHKNNEGEVIGVIVHATDVTQSKLTEIALKESESKLRTVLDAAPVAISVFVGRDLVIENPNDRFTAVINKGSSIAGQPLKTVLKSSNSEDFLKSVQMVLRSGESFYESGMPGINTTEKEMHYHNISLTPLTDESGEVYAVLYVGWDVTDEIVSIKKAEQAESALRSAVEVAQLGTWSLDISSGITTVSERHASMFGLKANQMPSSEIRALIKPSDYNRVTEAFFAAQKPGSEGRYEAEYRIIHGITGQEKVIHAVGQTYFDLDGKPLVIQGTAQDITIHRELQLALESEVELRTNELEAVLKELQSANTDLRHSNDALKHSNQELAQFAYVASHDLQEPLRKIQIFAGILQENLPRKDPKVMIQKIAFSAARMSQLITDLLSFSRLIQPQKSLQPIDLNEVIKNIWIDFELAVEEKNAVIEVEKLPVVKAVGLQMNQLFYNLVGNSLKFTRPDTVPKIKISAVQVTNQYAAQFTDSTLIEGQYHHILFSDNGIGFEKGYEKQIFEIFKRLHEQNIYPGSGIGLALCRRIVTNHHGVMYAESEYGKGSTFHIFLPVS